MSTELDDLHDYDSDDFCMIHGYEFMRRRFGDLFQFCEKCEEDRIDAEKRDNEGVT